MQYPTKKLLDLHLRGLLQYLGKLGADDGNDDDGKALEWNSTFAKAFGSWCRRSPANVLIQVRANLEELQSALPGSKPLEKTPERSPVLPNCHELVSSLARPEDPWQHQGHHQSNPVVVLQNLFKRRLMLQGIFCSWRRAVLQLHLLQPRFKVTSSILPR